MRIFIDEDLPGELIAALNALGHDAEHVYSKNLNSTSDRDLFAFAQAEDRLLITKDVESADARELPAIHSGFVLVRMQDAGLRELIERLRSVFETENVESWRGCIVVVDRVKVRVRRPAQ